MAEAGERLQVTGASVTAQIFKAIEGDALVSGGSFHADRLASAGDFTMKVTGGDFTVGTFEGAGGNFTLTGGQMAAGKLDITGGSLVLKDGGNLVTSSGQLFTNAMADDGMTDSAGSLTSSASHITVSDAGKITVNDAKYNLVYANSAAKLFEPALSAGSSLIFTGAPVELEVDIGSIDEGTTHANLTGKVQAPAGSSSASIDRSIGVKDLQVDAGVSEIKVAPDKILTLVGSDDASDSLVKTEGNDPKLLIGAGGTLALGLDDDTTRTRGGTIQNKIDATGGTIQVNGGAFSLASVRAEDGKVAVNAGSAKIDTLTLAGAGSSVSNGTDKALDIKKAVIETAEGAAHKITGDVNLGEIVASGDDAAGTTIRVGENKDLGDASNQKGSLTVAGSLAGLNYFLDPAYVDGQEVTDASSLVFNEATVDGNVVVGQNAIAVLGADGSGVEKLSDALAKSHTAWGRDGTLAAVYVGQPITVTGGLHVDQAATLTSTYTKAVTFADKSVLVADVTNAGDAPMITASSFSIDEGAKAVLAGDLKAGDYRITSGTAEGEFFTNVVAANALWGVKVGADGLVTARLEDASKIYGGLMQGASLANAGMAGTGADYDYVNALLSDANGGLSALPSTAARFDAAMNPAGALTVFTTAYDRASELRDAVREEAVKGEGSRLWVHVAGGKTKLKGISTGAQGIHAKTKTYGLVAGAEADIAGVGTAGAAFQAGTGDTKNSAVSAKDDFDYYGFSLYGKTTAAGIDLLADASVSWVKSDLSVGGVADVKADTTTTVWSAGLQAQKTFATQLADVTPFIGLDLYHVRGDSFCTGHGACVEKSNATAVEIPVGVKLEKGFATASGVKVSPAFSFSVAPVAGDKSITSPVAFAGAKSDYDFTFADDVKVRSSLGVDLEKGSFSAGLHAGYAWGNEERNAYRVELRAKYAF